MTLLRMLAFRPDAPADRRDGRATATPRPAPPCAARARAPRRRPHGAAPQATAAPPIAPAPPPRAADAPRRRAPANIDAASWPRIVEGAGLSGMVRQFALNCVPASFERDVLTLRLDEAVDARRSRAIEDKLAAGVDQISGPRDPAASSRCRRASSRRRRASARSRIRTRSCARPRPSRRIRSSRDCRSDSAPRWIALR